MVKVPQCGFGCEVSNDKVQIKVRKTAKGKKLTVLSGIFGDRTKAVTTLKHLLGVGGELSKEDFHSIELQGDQTKRLESILRTLGAIPKLAETEFRVETKKSSQPKKIVVPTLPNTPVCSEACRLVHGKFWPYCNGDCSYCPPLTDVFEGLEIYCDWYDPAAQRKTKQVCSDTCMPQAELEEAFETLGLRASVGQALLTYKEEKAARPERIVPISSVGLNLPRREEVVFKAKPKPVVKRVLPNRPVRVILNNKPPQSTLIEYPSAEIGLLDDLGGWMCEYQNFVVTMMEECFVSIVNQEMEDSKHLMIFFSTIEDRDRGAEILGEVMPNFFHVRLIDGSCPHPENDISIPDNDIPEEDEMFMYQRLAVDLGVDSNESFWELFCSKIDDSDGSAEGIQRAFQEAVVGTIDSNS